MILKLNPNHVEEKIVGHAEKQDGPAGQYNPANGYSHSLGSVPPNLDDPQRYLKRQLNDRAVLMCGVKLKAGVTVGDVNGLLSHKERLYSGI